MPATFTWIICETKARWATAVRAALSRQLSDNRGGPRIREVRTLAELATVFAEQPGLALIEVSLRNLGDVLSFVVAPERPPNFRFAALLEQLPVNGEAIDSQSQRGPRQLILDVLLEAGAVHIVDSPRRADELIALGPLHVDLIPAEPDDELSLIEWAQVALPWQGGKSTVA